jgi:hypothetical protein
VAASLTPDHDDAREDPGSAGRGDPRSARGAARVEGQWWQLEREIARSDGGSAGKLPHRHSSRPRPVAVRPRRSTDQHRSNAARTELLMSHQSLCSRRSRACRRKLYATAGRALWSTVSTRSGLRVFVPAGEPRRHEQPRRNLWIAVTTSGPSGSSSATGRRRRPRSPPHAPPTAREVFAAHWTRMTNIAAATCPVSADTTPQIERSRRCR